MAEEKTEVGPLLVLGGLAALGGAYLLFKRGGPAPGKTYKLIIESGPNGTTIPSPGQYEYPYGTQVSVYAQASQGYKFDRWTGDVPSTQEELNPVTLLIQTDLRIKANFVVNPTPVMYTVTFEASAGGSVSPSGTHTYEQYTYVTVQAIPESGYKFVGWSGDWTGTQNPDRVYISRDNMLVRANFTPTQQRGVQLQAGWNEAITYDGNSGTCEQVFASVVPYLSDVSKPIWIYRNGVWYSWFPNSSPPAIDPPPNNQVLRGDLVYIYVTQACFWSWP